MTDERIEFDYWAVEFTSEQDLQCARRHLPVSGEVTPHVALVDRDRMDDAQIREAVAAMGVSFIIVPSSIRKDEMWPEDAGDEDESARPAL